MAGALLLSAGIGLLKCREWARRVVIGWAIYSVIAAVGKTYVSVTYIQPVVQKAMDAMLKEQSRNSGADAQVSTTIAQMTSIAGTIGAVVTVLFSVALAVTLIVLVTRPQAKSACRTRL